MKPKTIKHKKTRVFFNAISIFSFLSLSFISSNANALTLPSAQQIAFKVINSNPQIIDQPAVVIDGRNGVTVAPHATAPQQRTNVNSSTPSLAMEPAVEGFADKVPLTVAIQQILPQGYGYTLGDGVDPGQLVSWRGGRPWNVVLQDMLAPSALAYSVNGRSVAISSVGVAPTIVTGIAPLQPVQQQPLIQPVQQQSVMIPQNQQQVVMQQPMMQQQPQQQPMPQIMPPPLPPQQVSPQQIQQQQMQPQIMMQQHPQQHVMVMDVPQQQVQVQQPQVIDVPAATATGPQPLQIENPLVFQSQTWEVRPGQTLRKQLQEWCNRAGVELNWTAEFDYPIMASMNMTGTFEEAVRTLLIGFDGAKPTPRGRLHYNPAAGQSILIVEADGNHYGD
ncbi:MAG: hypothetical protein EB059_00935 [Alphaproteobacteria bacterium]|nr:hypothetical protein [Alphaproteobacteria bacterium]